MHNTFVCDALFVERNFSKRLWNLKYPTIQVMPRIDPDRKLLKEFERLFLLSTDGKQDYFLNLCKNDPALCKQLKALISGIETQDLLHSLNLDRVQIDLVGQVVDGRYIVEEQIGQGGMGIVYKAFDQSLDRIVALKVIRFNTFGSSHHIIRFLSEKQVLAKFQHPLIAQIFDSGFVEEHLPYFVMEFVDGVPIDTYCDQHRLNIDERIRLFTKVCEAVQAAHQQFIIHKDIKPSNILITNKGDVKLVDFGIASLLNSEESTEYLKQNTPFTPAYAAPEQVSNGVLGTYSDVYALGILLYEILVGFRPYSFPPESPDFVKIVCNSTIEKPSLYFVKKETSATGSDGQVAAARSTKTEQLKRKISGDLDAIVIKALEKKPENRYKTAYNFSLDLKNYLNQRPVSARTSNFTYKSSKFVQRYTARLVFAATLIFMALGLVSIHTTRLTKERNVAEKALQKTDRVVEFIIDLFQETDPYLTPVPSVKDRRNLTVGALLEKSVDQIQEDLNEEPEIKAEILRTLGRLQDKLGSLNSARALLSEALELQNTLPGASSAEIVSTQKMLGVVESKIGNFSSAEKLYLAALQREKEIYPDEHFAPAITMANLGLLYRDMGQLDKADSLSRLGVQILNNTLGKHHYDTIVQTIGLGSIMQDKREFTASDSIFADILPIAEEYLGPDHLLVAQILNNQAVNLSNLNQSEQAVELYKKVLEIRADQLGTNHREYSNALSNMAVALERMKKYDQAVPLYNKALSINIELFGEDNINLAITYSNLAVALQRLGDKKQAELFYRKALDLRQTHYDSPHVLTALSLSNLANFLRKDGRYNEADPLYQEALSIRKGVLGEKHRYVATLLLDFGDSKRAQNDYHMAEKLYTEAIDIRSSVFPKGHDSITRAQKKLDEVRAYLAKG